jgi:hypothetical protein
VLKALGSLYIYDRISYLAVYSVYAMLQAARVLWQSDEAHHGAFAIPSCHQCLHWVAHALMCFLLQTFRYLLLPLLLLLLLPQRMPLSEYRAIAKATTVIPPASGKPLKKRKAQGSSTDTADSKRAKRKDGDKDVRRPV